MSKVPDFEYKFHIGKKKPSTVRFVIVGVALGILADILAKYLKVPQQNIWDLIDEIGRTFKIEDINNLVLAHSKLLERRIERDVDNAIEDYLDETEEPPVLPIFTEDEKGETELGGEMRLTAPWKFEDTTEE